MRLLQLCERLRRLAVPSALAIAALTAAPASAMSFEYDALGRVTKVIYDDGSYVQYQYDAAGNRTVVAATKN